MHLTTKRRRCRGDGGAVLIEAIVVLPLLLMFVFGIAEFGFTYHDNITLTTTTRSGARVSSNLAEHRRADFETLKSIVAAIGSSSIGLDHIEGVLIFNANGTTSTETVPANCFDAFGDARSSSVAGAECNFYDTSQMIDIAAMTPAQIIVRFGEEDHDFTDGCGVTAWDKDFCPVNRSRTPNPQTEYVGVWVQIKHDYTTGLLPWDSVTLEDSTVMGIEPIGAL
ncbi:MAG: TadE/TadG family type IV pilus assembly protein [Acidimicrobiales bacterium]